MKINLLDINISSKFKYQMTFFACAVIHICFFLIFALSHIYVLTLVNIFSIAFYIAAAYNCGKGEFEKNALKWIIATYAEITIHAVLATVHLGYDTYFFLYAMVELSISAYMLFFTCDKKIFSRMIIIFLCVSLTALAGCQVYLSFKPPVFTWFFDRTLSPELLDFMRFINILSCTIVVFLFSLLFVIEINSLIKQLKAAYDKMNYTAMHDSLTGLYNRHSLKDFFESLDESGNEYCVALGDIDNFKKVNDTYGHDCGDEVLVTVSDIIKDSMAEQDLACRWGGEEILIIMRGTREDCLGRMNSIRSKINSSVVETGNSNIRVTMTFGFADCHEVENSEKNHMDSIVILVDGRLYKGKNSGKNVIVSL
ncbi:MAG: GGDEF domain-containing protein [Ruminococcus sp.]|nr:GGDEF domain-containing protein [Ruminococcus sp.]MCM1381884.1 GGDEF domain-containing protein [Muribaculaceae bacterium]MCM1480170.1 GGDEF domain-containing protein [Muribaculaceae bacterium]